MIRTMLLLIILSPFAIVCGIISITIIYALLNKTYAIIFNKKKDDDKC